MSHFQKIISKTVITICVALLTLGVMGPGLKGGFFFDDTSNIVKNESIHISELTLKSLQQSLNGPASGPLGRPISVLSFAVTHYFFGLDPFSFKAINLAIHLLNGLLVGWLVSLLLRMSKINVTANVHTWLPIWVSAIWLVHPINIAPVMLTVQRMTLLSATFLLLALNSHLKAILVADNKKWIWGTAAWLVLWPLSVLSKETALLFPLYVLVITFFLVPSTPGKPCLLWFLIGILSAITLTAGALLGWDWLNLAYATRPFSLEERLLTESRVLWFYLAQIIVPNFSAFGIYLDGIPISKGLLAPPSTIISLLGWAIVIVALFFLRLRQPMLSMGMAWFLAGHSLESTFLPLEIAYEHRNYIPSIGLILGIGFFAMACLQKLRLDHKKITITLVAVIPLIVLALFTWLRAQQLGDPLLGPQIEASRHPMSARANYAAAATLMQSGYGDSQDFIGGHNIQYYLTQAGNVDTTFKHGYLGLIIWSCASSRPVDPQWIDNLVYRLQNTPFAPGDRKLPHELLVPLINMPKCLTRQRALEILTAGTANPAADEFIRAGFYEAASDYELLVSLDVISAQRYLNQAATYRPQDKALATKLRSHNRANGQD